MTLLRKSLIILLLLLACTAAIAQKGYTLDKRFIFAVGPAGYSLEKSGASSLLPAVEISPMFIAYSRWTDFSFSVNSQSSLGYHISNDNLPRNFFFADVPLTAEFNAGNGSTKNFHSYFGFFGGAGYGWQFLGSDAQHGYVFTGGFRTWLGSLGCTFRYSYIYPNSVLFYNMQRVSIAISLGNWTKKVKQMNKISKFVKPVQ